MDSNRRGYLRQGFQVIKRAWGGFRKRLPGRLRSVWYEADGHIMFRLGGLADGAASRPAFCARNYYEIRSLLTVMDEHNIDPNRSLEIGCGYGRLSPWIAERADDHLGIDPNGAMIDQARSLYPHLQWQTAAVQNLDQSNVTVDFVCSWTVLQHVPPDAIDEAARAIISILKHDGHLLLCEETTGESEEHLWPRSPAEYNRLFSSSTLIDRRARRLEPGTDGSSADIMLFQNR